MSSATAPDSADLDGFEQRLRQRAMAKSHPLDTVPTDTALQPRGLIPNTPLSVAFLSFLLGSLFSVGVVLFVTNGYGQHWWSTTQLGFFIAAWSAFHWGEFAVTAGWNRDKCSVDCELGSFVRRLPCANVRYCSVPARERCTISHRAFCRFARILDYALFQTRVEAVPLHFTSRCASQWLHLR